MRVDAMNKRISKLVIGLISLIITGLIFTSFSNSLDGRAYIAKEGELPEGLFAMTAKGYLPGDKISVTTVDGESTVDVLVIGEVDASEGVAIMLSPEAAAQLGINRDESNIVKITKRSGLDGKGYGSAIIAPEKADAEGTQPAETEEQKENPVADDNVEGDNVDQEQSLPVEEAAVIENATDEAPTEENQVIEENDSAKENQVAEVTAETTGEAELPPGRQCDLHHKSGKDGTILLCGRHQL